MSEMTPEQAQQAVEGQVQGMAADLGAGPQAAGADLGAAAAAAGAQPGEVDAAALLAHIRAMQARLDGLEAAKRLEVAPEVVKFARAAADHMAAKAAANPALASHPDVPLAEGVALAGQVAEHAAAAAGDQPHELEKALAGLAAWVRRAAGVLPHVDFSYVLQLADEAGAAAAKLAA